MKIIKRKYLISCLMVLFLMLLMTTESNAVSEFSELNGKWFYIKNAFTGHYLDVDNGIAQGGTNIQQCEYNRFLCSNVVYRP